MPNSPTQASSSDDKASGYVKGLDGVIAAQTALSLVDGEQSRLFYRGICIEELTPNSSFEETVFLLWYGRLPTAPELAQFNELLSKHREIPKEVIAAIRTFPKTAHPMAVLRTLASMLSLFDSEADARDVEANRRKAVKLTAQFPTLIAAFHRYRKCEEPIAPDFKLSHAENFLYMMHGKKPEAEMAKALDAYLILLADHGLNASTFAARVTVATESDMYSGITSAIGTLKGDLHGSANQRAMEMILEINTPDRAVAYVEDLLAHKKKVMGFGHRIYKKQDPRATAFRAIAERMCEKAGDKHWMEISNRVEKVMWEKKQIPCNVDFFSASVLYLLGFPVDFFTTVFAASRVSGWTAHVIEQLSDNRLIRPSAVYTGPKDQHYVPMSRR
ncbi:MAG: citrate synthase [Omnitrophica bacterium GWA2_52_12]|nr:MAG: citrate synthase [Omnitrophica bacterium GWA2_52_12]